MAVADAGLDHRHRRLPDDALDERRAAPRDDHVDQAAGVQQLPHGGPVGGQQLDRARGQARLLRRLRQDGDQRRVGAERRRRPAQRRVPLLGEPAASTVTFAGLETMPTLRAHRTGAAAGRWAGASPTTSPTGSGWRPAPAGSGDAGDAGGVELQPVRTDSGVPAHEAASTSAAFAARPVGALDHASAMAGERRSCVVGSVRAPCGPARAARRHRQRQSRLGHVPKGTRNPQTLTERGPAARTCAPRRSGGRGRLAVEVVRLVWRHAPQLSPRRSGLRRTS